MTNTNSPIDFFSSISDPRVERTQKHSLESILFISLCAVICGAEGWNVMEDYGNAKIDWLKKFQRYTVTRHFQSGYQRVRPQRDE